MGQIRTYALQQIEVVNSQKSVAELSARAAGGYLSNAVRCARRQVAQLARKLPIKRGRAEFLVVSNCQHLMPPAGTIAVKTTNAPAFAGGAKPHWHRDFRKGTS